MIALAFAACQEKPEPDKPGGNGNGNGNEQGQGGNTTPEAYNEITVVLKAANLKTAWAAGDEVQVYCVTSAGADVEAKYVLTEGAGSATGKFAPAAGETALEKGGKDYFAAYPYDADRTFAQHNTFTVVVPAEQTAAMPVFGAATDAANIELSSFMGAIKFTITGEAELKSFNLEDNNTNTPLSGNVTYNAKTGKATFKNSSASKHEISYVLPNKLVLNGKSDPFIIEIPAGTLGEGGKLTLFDMNGNAAAVIDIPAQTINAGAVADIGNLTFEATSQTVDLSVTGTANCYIIPGTGAYKFKAVKGNTNEAVAAAKVEVLWETTNSKDAEVTAGSVIASAALEGNYVVVETAKPSIPGNALIAAKDADGKVLWSWHLWLPETTIADIEDPDGVVWKTALMDRNLGALVPVDTTAMVDVKSYGLGFQWGRVTPLVCKMYKVAGTELSGYEKVDENDGAQPLDYWIANPTVISSGFSNNWLNETVVDLWDNGAGEKTMYDPCPPGYKVPCYDTSYELWYTTSGGDADPSWVFNTEYKWFYNKTTKITFPVGGYIDGGNATQNKENIRSLIWSANPGGGDISDSTAEVHPRGSAAFVDISRDTGKYYYKSYFKYAGGSIRCAKEH